MGDDGPKGVRDWFRSDDVEYISIVLQEFCAHKVLSQLGRLGVVQFTDLNPTQTMFQRRYVKDVQRCDNIEHKLSYFDEQLTRFEVPVVAKPDIDKFLDRLERRSPDRDGGSREVNYMDRVELHIEEKESELVQLNRYNATLTADYYSQLELKSVLEKAREYAQENVTDATYEARSVPVGDEEEAGGYVEDGLRFRFVSGVCNQEHRNRLERMVFRSTRGNCLMKFYEIDELMEDVETGKKVKKNVFFIFFQSQIIQEKIKRIADAFQARLYQIPDLNNIPAIDQRASDVHSDINDRKRVLDKNHSDIVLLLTEVGTYIEVWKWFVIREKSIYHTLNLFSSDVQGVLRAEGWVLSEKKDAVMDIVTSVHQEMGDGSNRSLPSSVTTLPAGQWPSSPPTFNKVNKFTRVFQVIVDTYGVPRYQEANPALLTVVTFPFAFGIMFGDIGHGLLLFLFAAYVILNEKKMEKVFSGELSIIYGGRYMLLLMGFFAMYCGFIYNDWFAMGLRLWPTQWVEQPVTGDTIYFEPKGGVYPFGVDPTWHRATNDLLFLNSLKMKMAVIFGVTQMTIGLFHRAQNALYFNKKGQFNLDLWFEAIPMIVFMIALFGYMCLLIIYKWSLQWVWDDCNSCGRNNCCNPPGLITQLINIALKPGDVPVNEEIYSNQGTVQLILLLIAVCMIPLMLIPKPYFEIQRLKKSHGDANIHSGHTNGHADSDHTELMLGDSATSVEHNTGHAAESHGHEEHGPGEIIVHQCIETIEFSLGCISNTASYLRLWALSLAHSQLAGVFLEKALLGFIIESGASGVLLTFVGYAVFAAITFAVLMLMDNLECFLHALRLHWVEFQNKFFRGDGVAFHPLCFRTILTQE